MLLFGKAHLAGVSGSIATIGGTTLNVSSVGSAVIDTMSTKFDWDNDPCLNQMGEIIGTTARNHRLDVTITFIPYGGGTTDNTAACKALLALMPTTISTISLTDCPDTRFNVTYSIMQGADVVQTASGKAGIQMAAVLFDSITAANMATQKY